MIAALYLLIALLCIVRLVRVTREVDSTKAIRFR